MVLAKRLASSGSRPRFLRSGGRRRAAAKARRPAMHRTSHVLRLVLGVALSVGALAVVLARVEPDRLLEALRSVDLTWVAALAVARVGVLGLQAWRWQALLAGLGIPYRTVLDGTVLGMAGNNLLPARAGELLRIAWLSQRSGRPAASILVTVGMERVLDLTALGLVVAFTVPGILQGWDPRWLLALLLAAALGVGLFLARPRSGPIGGRVEALLQSFREALRDRLTPRLVATAALRTAVLWAAIAAMTAVGGRTVGLQLTPYQTAFVMVAVALGGALPSAPGNLGTFHLACAWALAWLGFAPGPAAAAAVVMHAVTYLVATLWGLAVGGSWLLGSRKNPDSCAV